ncbi:hypothetical protein N9N82_03205, partial [Luminiphilus sp.]|nr:hypothetical protein [Luminiphilus sp.]
NSDQEAINTRDGESGIITLEFDVADNQTLKSITSFQEMDRFLRDDLDSVRTTTQNKANPGVRK